MRCEECGPLLADFVDHNIDPTKAEAIEQHIEQCAACQKDIKQIQRLNDMAMQWRDETVPHWSRADFAIQARSGMHWMNWLSLATSLCAVLLVVFKMDIHHDTQGTHIQFGQPANSVTETASTLMDRTELDARLDQFAHMQQIKLENRLDEFELNREEHDRKLLTAALTYSRSQHREDMSQFANYWESARLQDRTENHKAIRRLYSSQQSELQTLKTNLLHHHSEAL